MIVWQMSTDFDVCFLISNQNYKIYWGQDALIFLLKSQGQTNYFMYGIKNTFIYLKKTWWKDSVSSGFSCCCFVPFVLQNKGIWKNAICNRWANNSCLHGPQFLPLLLTLRILLCVDFVVSFEIDLLVNVIVLFLFIIHHEDSKPWPSPEILHFQRYLMIVKKKKKNQP